MNYGVILSAGIGSRVEKLNIPKQYYKINGIPIIVYTIKKFVEANCFDYLYMTIDNTYRQYMEELLEKFFNEKININFIDGGKERIDSIHNVTKSIEKNKINNDDIILIHDGVRPFVSKEIIYDNIKTAKEFGACVTSSPVNDTILQSFNETFVDNIPIRSTLFKGQSPDTFNLKKFIEMINGLTEEQKKKVTGTSDICTFYNVPIKMVKGNNLNFKVTTDADLKIAELLLKDMGF